MDNLIIHERYAINIDASNYKQIKILPPLGTHNERIKERAISMLVLCFSFISMPLCVFFIKNPSTSGFSVMGLGWLIGLSIYDLVFD